MKTDIDQLHNLIKWRDNIGEHNLPRNCGKTFLKCHELVGAIEVGDFNTIVIEIPYYHVLNFLIPTLVSVLDERCLKHTYKEIGHVLLCNNKKVRFISSDDFENKILGIGDYYYQYME